MVLLIISNLCSPNWVSQNRLIVMDKELYLSMDMEFVTVKHDKRKSYVICDGGCIGDKGDLFFLMLRKKGPRLPSLLLDLISSIVFIQVRT